MMLQHKPPKVHKKHAFLFDINLYRSNPITLTLNCISEQDKEKKNNQENIPDSRTTGGGGQLCVVEMQGGYSDVLGSRRGHRRTYTHIPLH